MTLPLSPLETPGKKSPVEKLKDISPAAFLAGADSMPFPNPGAIFHHAGIFFQKDEPYDTLCAPLSDGKQL